MGGIVHELKEILKDTPEINHHTCDGASGNEALFLR